MKICKGLVIFFAIASFGMSTYASKVKLDPTSPVYKSWKYYKDASNEYNKGNYEQALTNAQKSLMFKPNKKSRKLIQQIREIGYSNVKTGIALINFKPELAKQYLTRSKALIDPKDKKTMAKIDGELRSLEGAPSDQSDQPDQSAQ